VISYHVGRKLKLSKAFLSDPHWSLIEADVGECTGKREGPGEGRGMTITKISIIFLCRTLITKRVRLNS